MAELGVVVVQGALYLVAFFWILGFIPIHARFRTNVEEGYNLRRDLIFSAALLFWMFAGFVLFQWIIPRPFNPFIE
jgi:hypothetical protein